MDSGDGAIGRRCCQRARWAGLGGIAKPSLVVFAFAPPGKFAGINGEVVLSRLVVVANRCNVPRKGQVPGGLAVALTSALRERGGVWFGWDGNIADDHHCEVTQTHLGGVDYASFPLSRDEYDHYYKGYSNRVLWPLCHYRIDAVQYQRRYDDVYRRTNERFARDLLRLLKADDIVWVHDYHLIPLGRALRLAGVTRPIGFFLHIPFPPYDVLRILPGYRELLWELGAYDLVGFQTEPDKKNFLDALRNFTDADVATDGRFAWQGHSAKAASFPISIDPQEVRKMVTSGREARSVKRLQTSLQGRSLIVGIDRLDYSKGLPDRLYAYQRLLMRHPDTNGKVVFMQVAQPSRADVPEYDKLRRRLEAIVGDINGHFAEFDWAPVRYINKAFARSTLMNFLAMTRVGLVTPLRDGMNLVAKEFIAAQFPNDPGVLVLSEFAGAATELSAALIVNPYDPDQVADAMAKALNMPLPERKERWQSAFDVISRHDVYHWSKSFIAELEQLVQGPGGASGDAVAAASGSLA